MTNFKDSEVRSNRFTLSDRENVEDLAFISLASLPLLEPEKLQEFAEHQNLNSNGLAFLSEINVGSLLTNETEDIEHDYWQEQHVQEVKTMLGLSILGLSYAQLTDSGILGENRPTRQTVGNRIKASLKELYHKAPQEIQNKYSEEDVESLFSNRSTKGRRTDLVNSLKEAYSQSFPVNEVADRLDMVTPRQRQILRDAIEEGFKINMPRKSRAEKIKRQIAALPTIQGNEEDIKEILSGVTLSIFRANRGYFLTLTDVMDILEVPASFRRMFGSELSKGFPFGKVQRVTNSRNQTYYFIPKQYLPDILSWAAPDRAEATEMGDEKEESVQVVGA